MMEPRVSTQTPYQFRQAHEGDGDPTDVVEREARSGPCPI